MDNSYIVGAWDLGATSSRLMFRAQEDGGLISPDTLYIAQTNTTRDDSSDYLQENVDFVIKALLTEMKQKLTPKQLKSIRAFPISSHGSSNFICLDEKGEPVFGTPSYDHILSKDDHDAFYKEFGDPDQLYLETGTPNLPNALNWAKMLFHHKLHHPEKWKQVKYIIPLNVYVGTRLCGTQETAVSERTQTHNHGYGENNQGDFSSVIKAMEIEDKFPPFKASYEAMGTIAPELAEKYGLSKDVLIVTGGHDSSLFASLSLSGHEDAIAISSGTWDVVMAQRDVVLDPRLQIKGLLYNADIQGNPLRTVNFRRGDMRKRYLLRTQHMAHEAPFSHDALQQILTNGKIIEPAYMNGFGPYPNTGDHKPLDKIYVNDPILFHHALAMSFAIQRALAVEIAGNTELPERLSLTEFSESNVPVIVGGKIAEAVNGKMSTSLEVFRRVVKHPVYTLDFPEPTSVATHVLGVCAIEDKKPQHLDPSRIHFPVQNVSFFENNDPAIEEYIKTFEKKLGI